MNALGNHLYLGLYILSNVVAVLVLWASWKRARLARLLLSVIFAWASWTNWNEALVAPQYYLEYSNLALLGWYSHFINGWFSTHILVFVGSIATCQAVIAVSMWLKGWLLRAGVAGGALFLFAIAPLGVGAAFPCTVITGGAMLILLYRKRSSYLWTPSPPAVTASY